MFGGSLEVQYAAREARASLSASILCNACIAAMCGVTVFQNADRLKDALYEHVPR